MNKILITGAKGFIGKYFVKLFENRNDYDLEFFEDNILTVNWNEYMKKVKPDYLVNLAWRTGEGYLNDYENVLFVKAGIDMYNAFYECGGKRAVYIGTEQEYDYKMAQQKESDLINPQSLYAECKASLGKILVKNSIIANRGFVWCRIFFVFGYGEKEARLMPSIIKSMLNNEDITCSYDGYVRDYIYVKDVASAIYTCLFSDYTGYVNVAGGEKTTIGEIGSIIKRLTNSNANIKYKKEEECNQNYCSYADISLLKSLGWKKEYSLEEGLKEEIKLMIGNDQYE